jgi:hypothetical protein
LLPYPSDTDKTKYRKSRIPEQMFPMQERERKRMLLQYLRVLQLELTKIRGFCLQK